MLCMYQFVLISNYTFRGYLVKHQ